MALPQSTGNTLLLTATEACERLRCSLRTLDTHVKNGLPFVRLGSRRRFDVDALSAWIGKHVFVAAEPAANLMLRRFMQANGYADDSRSEKVVYFAQAGEGGPIKIGVTRPPINKRLKSLATGCAERIALLGTIPGGERTEKALHHMFASRRMEGEWFKPSQRMLRFISELTAPETP